MRNRSAIWVFTILLITACLYQLSFTWVTDGVEAKADAEGAKKYNEIKALSTDGTHKIGSVEYTLFGEDGKEDAKTRTVIQDYYSQEYLRLHAGDEVYPVFGISYQKCKERQLGLGLDLQGGMSISLEVSIPELVKNLAGDPIKESFTQPFASALKRFEAGESNDFIQLFADEYNASDYKDLKMNYFSIENPEDFDMDMSNDQIVARLKEIAVDAIDDAQRVIETRINKFGVAQPTIQKQPISGRIHMELPGAKDRARVRNLVQKTANLEFWDGYRKDLTSDLIAVNRQLKVNEGLAEEKVEFVEKDTATLDSLELIEYNAALAAHLADTIPDQVVATDPLFSILKNFGNESGQMTYVGPSLGYANEVDTAKINLILREAGLPSNIAFLWGAKAEEINSRENVKEDAFILYAIDKSVDEARINGEGIADAMQDYDQSANVVVNVQMSSYAKQEWADWTTEKVGEYIAIVLDDEVYSCPVINEPITGGNTQISGNFTIEEGQDLATILNAGSLPAPAKIVDEAVVGPTMGEENIEKGMWSFVIAMALVLVYMIFYYNKAGMVACVALIANIFFILGTLASMGAALTLSGIAGLVLTIGMSVDANVLIYERIREEIRAGKGIKLAIADGYKHAYSAIVDANITSLLTAIILAYFGSGPILGFATTLIVGVFTSLFSAIFVTRLIFSHMLDKKWSIKFGSGMTNNLMTNTSFNFLQKRKIYYLLSTLVVVGGIASMAVRGLDGSVEFTGGRTYRITFSEAPGLEDLKSNIAAACINEEGKPVSPEVKTVNNEFTFDVTTKFNHHDKSLEATEKVDNALDAAFEGMGYHLDFEEGAKEGKYYIVMSHRSVDPQISNELVIGSLWAIIVALVMIFLYIALRFQKWQFGLGALVAMFHDVMVVLGLFSIFYGILPFSLEIDQAFIAAILTVVGYSINDTVVVFDRIREYTGLYKRDDQNQVVNKALNSTLSRTLNTSLSTFLVLLTIFIFGSDTIKGFSFALMVGVVVGTYSSIFIATPSVLDLTKGGIMPASKTKK